MRINPRLWLFMLLFYLLPMLVLAGWHFYDLYTGRIQRNLTTLDAIAQIQATRLQDKVRHLSDKTLLISSRRLMRESFARYLDTGDPAALLRVDSTLQDAIQQVPEIASIQFEDGEGRVTHTVGTTPEPSASLLPLVPRADAKVQLMAFESVPGGTLFVRLSTPLELDGRPLGRLVLRFDAREFLDVVNDYTGFGETGETVVGANDANGVPHFILPRRFERLPVPFVPIEDEGRKKVIAALLRGEVAHLLHFPDYRGHPTIASVKLAPRIGWFVAAKRDRAEALGNFYSNLAVTLLTIVLVGLLITAFSTRFVTRRVIELERMAAGYAGELAEQQGADELSALERSLRKIITRLENSNQELETRVAERTQQLGETHAELVSAQSQIMQASKLAALGELSASIAHEVKQPLTAIKLLTYSLATASGDPVAQEDLREIGRQVDRVTQVMDSIRRSARAPEGEAAHPVAVREAIESALHLFQHELKKSGVTVSVDLPDNLPQALADRAELQQVFVNLIGNAKDALEQAPRKQIALRGHQKGEQVIVAVEDSGPGISDSARQKLFQSFFTTKPTGKGTGLGLSLSRRMVARHGGTLELDPDYRDGARFLVTLQAAA